jgi:hypothetical protein
MGAFGAVIPVTGLHVGFVGQVSRTNAGEPAINARQANNGNTLNIFFGDPVVVQPDSLGGTYTSIADWIANSSGLITPDPSPVPVVSSLLPFAGIAVREVKTLLTFPLPPGTSEIGQYLPGYRCEVLERGSIVIQCRIGTPQAGYPCYLRILANGAKTAGKVGYIEAAADTCLATTMATTQGSATITVGSYSNVVAGMAVVGPGLPDGTYVATTPSSTSVAVTQAATATLTAAVCTFSWTIMLPRIVFSTGVMDSNNCVEVTLLDRLMS